MRTLSTLVVCAALAVCCALLPVQSSCAPDIGKPMKLPDQPPPELTVGGAVDVAPFGEVRDWDGKAVGVVWEDARDVAKLVVKFADGVTAPDPASVKLQYWRDRWPEERAPRDKLLGSGGSGWMEAGDWYQGKWQDADCQMAANGGEWTYTFNPINAKEFTQYPNFNATYRTTLKIRLLFPDKAPRIACIKTYTDSVWQQGSVIVEWGGTATSGDERWDGKAEAFNGYVTGVRALAGSKVSVNSDRTWASTVNKGTDGIALDLWYAKPVPVSSFDESIVTVRARQHTFSFLAREAAEGKRMYIRDYGVIVKGPRDSSSFAEAEKAYQSAPKDVYRRVFDMPEQTLVRALSDMPTKSDRMYMPLSCEGSRQQFRLDASGDVTLFPGWIRRINSTDSDRCKWDGDLRITLGIPTSGRTGADLEDGTLPIPNTWYEKGGIRYSEDAFATMLAGKLPKEGRVTAEEPVVLMLRFRLTNLTGAAKTAELPIGCGNEKLVEENGMVYAQNADGKRFRMLVNTNGAGTLSAKDGKVVCSVQLPADAVREYYVMIPYLTLESPAELDQLKKLNYDAQHKMIADYWKKRYAACCQVTTPEPMINQFYMANPSHQLINCESEVGNTGCLMAKVGTFFYGVYTNESVMMSSDMDRRGLHDEAARVYESWIRYQGSKPLPGDYTDNDGVFYGVNRYQSGGYNQHHGWALWGIGEHYWFTRDNAWLDRVAPNIVKACDWVTQQRARTSTDECAGIRSIERGLLPPGSLEDIGDWRSWMSNNVFSWWGMKNAVMALVERGHPEGMRLLRDVDAYGQDIRAAFFAAMERSPVVALRDGTYVPNMPSEVHRRGRSFGWITETLEGSIHMLRCGLIQPDEPIARWIMQDYEDNRYLSDQFGYQTPYFDRDWFSIGGFSQQPSLLCSPTPYIQRDEPEHYLRAYFNAFAAGYFPERKMLTEHPLPNLGDIRGDHFKSSDEAMNCSWIRWMFIWDEGSDLHLGRVMPRYWLADGKTVRIERAATHFGPMSMSMTSHADTGSIEMTIDPPTRNQPKAIYARFRHPDGKSMNRVTVNGKPWDKFDPAKEWVVLPPLKEKTVVVAYYD